MVKYRETTKDDMRMWSNTSCPSGKTVSAGSGRGGDAVIGGGTNVASCVSCLSKRKHCIRAISSYSTGACGKTCNAEYRAILECLAAIPTKTDTEHFPHPVSLHQFGLSVGRREVQAAVRTLLRSAGVKTLGRRSDRLPIINTARLLFIAILHHTSQQCNFERRGVYSNSPIQSLRKDGGFPMRWTRVR